MTDDLCSACGKREGENHDLPGRCQPTMAKITVMELRRLQEENERLRQLKSHGDQCAREADRLRAFYDEVVGELHVLKRAANYWKRLARRGRQGWTQDMHHTANATERAWQTIDEAHRRANGG